MPEMLPWLLRCADRLRGEQRGAIDIGKLLRTSDIEVRTIESSRGSGSLGQGKDGRYIITIKQREGTLLWSPRDRFTAAHELGHFLLIKKWNFKPSPSERKEYFLCEQLCNRFAGRLLVDAKEVAAAKPSSANACQETVRRLARRFDVSLEVAARELAEQHTGIACCLVQELRSEPRNRLVWGVSSLRGLHVTRSRLMKEAPIGMCLSWCNELLDGELFPREPSVSHRIVTSSTSLVTLVTGDNAMEVTRTDLQQA
jgi:hypothetical protein